MNTLTDRLADTVDTLIPLVLALAVLFFLWSLAQFIRGLSQGDTQLADGKRKLIWGTITLFVMVSIWGIIGLVQKEFGIKGGGAIDAPTVNIPRSQPEGLGF